MSNCKQGDLAIIVRANDSENLGKIVEVVRLYPLGERMLSLDGRRVGRITKKRNSSPLWVIRSHGSPLVWSNSGTGVWDLYAERAFNDEGLRPIPKLDEPTEVSTNQDLGVPA
jgi:hypothetical protein